MLIVLFLLDLFGILFEHCKTNIYSALNLIKRRHLRSLVQSRPLGCCRHTFASCAAVTTIWKSEGLCCSLFIDGNDRDETL